MLESYGSARDLPIIVGLVGKGGSPKKLGLLTRRGRKGGR